MFSHLEGYIEPILSACLLFPVIAGLFTLPFMIRHYRRYGGIAFMRVIIVYSFILYSMCAFLLTVLPLPSREAVEAMQRKPIGWIPFYDLYVGLGKAGFTLSSPSTLVDSAIWKRFLTSSDLFQILANIAMQVPLGFYLRYYFRRSWKQTLIIGFCVSLFYELTQLSGLFFIYPKPYRYTEVDDLINNTLGAMLGYWIAPLLCKLLPKRDEIDKISYDKGHRITVMRRVVAAVIDWALYSLLWAVVLLLPVNVEPSMWFVSSGFFGYILWVLLYFGVAQRLFKGRTMGKALLKIKVVSCEDGASPPKLRQLFIRYAMIYFLTLPLMMLGLAVLAVIGLFTVSPIGAEVRVALIVFCALAVFLTLFGLLRSFRKYGMFPHGHYSRTTIVLTAPRTPFEDLVTHTDGDNGEAARA